MSLCDCGDEGFNVTCFVHGKQESMRKEMTQLRMQLKEAQARIDAYEKEDEHEAMDCYVKHERLERLEELEAALKNIASARPNGEVPDIDCDDEADMWQAIATTRRNIARESLAALDEFRGKKVKGDV